MPNNTKHHCTVNTLTLLLFYLIKINWFLLLVRLLRGSGGGGGGRRVVLFTLLLDKTLL